MAAKPPPAFPFQTGALESPLDSRDYPARMKLPNTATRPDGLAGVLPTADRLRWMPPVFTQVRGSCVGQTQSTIGMLHEHAEAGGSQRIDGELWYDQLAIEQFGAQNDVGLIPRASLDSWLSKGPPVAYGDPAHFTIEAYYRVYSLEEAQEIITLYRQPVMLVSKIAISWGETTPAGQLFPIDYYGPNTPDPWTGGLHAWTVWGYDLRPTLGVLLRSSWGYEYGKNGNCYMTPEQWDESFVEAWWAKSKVIT